MKKRIDAVLEDTLTLQQKFHLRRIFLFLIFLSERLKRI